MIRDLSRDDRDRLFQYLIAAMWADGEVAPEELDVLTDMLLELELDAGEMQRVTAMLHSRPRVDELKASDVPLAHREMLVDAVRRGVLADGEVSERELATVRQIGNALGVPIALPGDDEREG